MKNKSNKVCYLFTQNYPYGFSEVFVEREIEYLCNYFEKVYVFPYERSEGQGRLMPSNADCIFFDDLFLSNKQKVLLVLRNIYFLFLLISSEFLHHPIITSKKFRERVSEYLVFFRKKEELEKFINNNRSSESIFYSYWFDRWTSVIAMLKNRGSFITRTHAFDLYEEDNLDGIIPNRQFQIRRISRVYAVSKAGSDYLKKLYPRYSQKFTYSYLGTVDHNFINPLPSEAMTFKIISSGLIQERKRHFLMLDVLERLPENYSWVHFGGGSDLETLKSKAASMGLKERVDLKGFVTNEDFFVYLSETPVLLFISLSKNEGLPYSMMEAISFGIPLLSTDVGGCSEICNSSTGLIIPKDFNLEEVVENIYRIERSHLNSLSGRKQIKNFWDNNFKANKNYFEFYNEISKC